MHIWEFFVEKNDDWFQSIQTVHIITEIPEVEDAISTFKRNFISGRITNVKYVASAYK